MVKLETGAVTVRGLGDKAEEVMEMTHSRAIDQLTL